MIAAGMILLAMIFAAVTLAVAVRRYQCFFKVSCPQGVGAFI
jgi:nucleotide-binding universal stress UspA family protein